LMYKDRHFCSNGIKLLGRHDRGAAVRQCRASWLHPGEDYHGSRPQDN
jgi:hypothetical protein